MIGTKEVLADDFTKVLPEPALVNLTDTLQRKKFRASWEAGRWGGAGVVMYAITVTGVATGARAMA